ncbi:MAG TPA: SprB repeat-containing protein, partial [Bacteroidia bacterium]|nr:SprB repeat-containing protein [Bacteroidia bacterium]
MRRVILLLLFTCLSAGYLSAQTVKTTKASGSQTGPGTVKWTVGNECMPGHLQAFQENKGQFYNSTNDWTVKYGAFYNGSYILFTDHGILNVMPEAVPMTEDDFEAERIAGVHESEKDKKQVEKENRKKAIYHVVSIEWENCNNNPVVEAVDETPFYFGAVDPLGPGKSVDNVKGYKKLIYHDLYPGIDVEFTFHQGEGIEYTLKVKPGFDASAFKMKYRGQSGLSIDETGNIHLTTPLGDIIDHAPVSNQNGNKIESSFDKISGSEVAFKLGSYDKSQGLIIDPWLVNPTKLSYVPYDCGMDATDNVFVMGSASVAGVITMYVQKYTTAGALSWTYTLSQYTASGFPESQSDMAVDPAGNTYVPSSYSYSNASGFQYAMIKLNAGGTLNYFYNTYPGTYTVFEIWNVAYSCNYAKLVEAGSPSIYQEEVGVVNASNGTITGYSAITTDQLGEIYTGTIAPNGDYYCIGANPDFCPTFIASDSLVRYSLAGANPIELWSANTGYTYDDYDFKSMYSIPTNGIAASCAYVYTSDGYHLDQRSLTTGKSQKQVVIPNGDTSQCSSSWTLGATPACSGLAVDMQCGYVYAGSNGQVVVYDQNLNKVTTVGAYPGYVFDVSFNAGLVAACGSNATATVGFVTQFAAQTCPGLTITHTNGSCKTLATATVATPTFCTGPYTYLWSPGGQTTQTATGLSTGVYTVTVGTSTACVTVTDTVTIFSAGVVNVTAISTGSACTGTATATATGGASPYSYLWNSGQTTSVITAVPAGNYTCTVTDVNGCIGSAIVTVNTSGPAVTPTSTNVICFGGKSGSASLTVTGGTPGYTYKWTSGQTTSSVNGLAAGNYTCTVTDKGGCS